MTRSKNIAWKICENEKKKSPENPNQRKRKIDRLLLTGGAENPVIIIKVTGIVFFFFLILIQ